MSELLKPAGDPDGKRLFRQRSAYAEEACRIAECLAIYLRRAGLPNDDAKSLALRLREQSVELLEKAEGRIEARLTGKNTGHPLLEGRPGNCLYLDESGTAALAAADMVFALGGVAMNEESVLPYTEAADELKLEFFGTKNIVLHEPMMRKHNGIYWFEGNRTKQGKFDRAIRDLIERTPFVALGVAIRKPRLKDEFIDPETDPYLPTKVYDLAIMLMIERYVTYLATNHERRLGRVNLESIGPREDAEHQAAYSGLLLHGTQFVSERIFQSWVESGCRFNPKQSSNPAELADIVAREVFEWVKSDCKVAPLHWDVLEKKFWHHDHGHYGNFGLKVFPATDLVEETRAHRAKCASHKN